MAQADLLVSLLKNVTSGDQVGARKLAEKIIQNERSKGHRILADRMAKALQPEYNHPSKNKQFMQPNGGYECKELIYEITPRRELGRLVLSRYILSQIQAIVEEQHRSDLLHAHNLRARNRILLAGPPGNGKTVLAEALAYELMYPLVVIRYETLIGSYLGETANRLKHVLDYAKTQRCVLFLDEFETLGKNRGDIHETGEIKRVVSSLLLQIDDLPDYVVVVAASNHPELLDKAVWRRFQVRLELPMPTVAQLAELVSSIEKRCQINFGLTPKTIAKHIDGINFSEAEEFCLGVVRQAVLEMKTDNAKSIVNLRLKDWNNRLVPFSNHKTTE